MSSAEANACWTVTSEAPVMPSRRVTVVRMDMRRCAGTKAAMTMMSGKNEPDALPARAMLRSTNSVSSIQSHILHSSVCSAQPRMTWARPRTFSTARRLVLSMPGSAMIPSLVSADRTRLQGTPVSVLNRSFWLVRCMSLPGQVLRTLLYSGEVPAAACTGNLSRPSSRRLGDDQVDAVGHEPETDNQAPRDDDLVGVGVDPGPEPG